MNRQFPALSGLAIVLIVLNHAIQMGMNVPVRYGFPEIEGGTRVFLGVLQGLGVFAVPTFLFISGAFVTYAARGEPPQLTSKFLRRGLLHICCPYVLWSGVFYFIVFFQFGQMYSLPGYAKNLLVGYPYHFVPLLVFFYLLAPLLVRFSRQQPLLLLSTVAALQLVLLGVLHERILQGWKSLLLPPVVGGTLANWAIYFPLGLVYGTNTRSFLPWLKRWKTPLVVTTCTLFVLGALHYNGVISMPLAGSLSAFPLVLLLPVIDRHSVPLGNMLESIGKRSYGLYLSHLIVIDLLLLAVGELLPGLFNYQPALLAPVFLAGIVLPLFLMRSLSQRSRGVAYRYIFG